MTRRRAADLLFVLTGPESYRAFVLGCGWSPRQWVRWVGDTLSRELSGTPDAHSGEHRRLATCPLRCERDPSR